MHQNRREWSVRKKKTDRHLCAAELLEKRRVWLPPERVFLEKAKILIRAPPDYAENADQYTVKIWNKSFFICGDRVVNGDEVPFSIDWDTQQLVTATERISLRPRCIPYLDKYKFGTLLIFMTPNGPLLTVLIFQGGEERVREELKNLAQSHSSHLVATANKKGCINTAVWKFAISALAQRTTTARGVTKDTKDWKYALALYVDNHKSHVNEEVCKWAFKKYGIIVRTLIPHSSHIMQAVDQHYGVLYKNMFKERVLCVESGIEILSSITNEVEMDKPKWRQLCVRVMADIVDEVRSL